MATDRERYESRMENIFMDQTSPDGTSLNVIEIQGLNTNIVDSLNQNIQNKNLDVPKDPYSLNKDLNISHEKKMMKHSSLMPKASEPQTPDSSLQSQINHHRNKNDPIYASAQVRLQLNQDKQDMVSNHTLNRRSSNQFSPQNHSSTVNQNQQPFIQMSMLSPQQDGNNFKLFTMQGNTDLSSIAAVKPDQENTNTSEGHKRWSKPSSSNAQNIKREFGAKSISPRNLVRFIDTPSHGITGDDMRAQAEKDLEFIKNNLPKQINQKQLEQQTSHLTKQQKTALENLYRNQQLQQQFYIRSFKKEVQKQQDKIQNHEKNKIPIEGSLWAHLSSKGLESGIQAPMAKHEVSNLFQLSNGNGAVLTETDHDVSFKVLPPPLSYVQTSELGQTFDLKSSIENIATKNASHLNLLQEPEGNIMEMQISVKPIVNHRKNKSNIIKSAKKRDKKSVSLPPNGQNGIKIPHSPIKKQILGQEAIQAAIAQEQKPAQKILKTIQLDQQNTSNVLLSSQSSRGIFTGGSKVSQASIIKKKKTNQSSINDLSRSPKVSASPLLAEGVVGQGMQMPPSSLHDYNNTKNYGNHKLGSPAPVRMPQIQEHLTDSDYHSRQSKSIRGKDQTPGTAEMAHRKDEEPSHTLPTQENHYA